MKTLLNRTKKVFMTGALFSGLCLSQFLLAQPLPSAGQQNFFLTEDCRASLVKAFQQPFSFTSPKHHLFLEEDIAEIIQNSECLSEGSKTQILLRMGQKDLGCTEALAPAECITPLEKKLMNYIILQTSEGGEVSGDTLAGLLFDIVFLFSEPDGAL